MVSTLAPGAHYYFLSAAGLGLVGSGLANCIPLIMACDNVRTGPLKSCLCRRFKVLSQKLFHGFIE
jgi:hypothetical protein